MKKSEAASNDAKDKPIGPKCTPSTWYKEAHHFMTKDPKEFTRLDAAMGMASVATGKCAWCGGAIREAKP